MVRIIFWLALVIAFIPVDKEELDANQRMVSTRETISLVQSAYFDVSQFCHRNPEPCDTGKELASQFGAKAKNGALLAYDYFDQHFSNSEDLAEQSGNPEQRILQTDPVSTGSTNLQ